MKRFDIVALGSLYRELLAWVDRFPGAGDGIYARESVWTAGGMAANLVHAVARLGGRTALICALGDDSIGDDLIAELQRAGVNTDGVLRRAGRASATCILTVNPEYERAGLILDIPTLATLQPDEIPDSSLLAARVFFTDLAPPFTAIETARRAARLGVPVAFDLQMALQRTNWLDQADDVSGLFAVTNYFFADEENFLLWRDVSTLEDAVHDALNDSPDATLVITRGLEGSLIATSSETISVPAFPVEIIDSIGAGDAYHGAFLYAHLSLGWRLRSAGLFASAVAALTCRGAGARNAAPDTEQAHRFLDEYGVTVPELGSTIHAGRLAHPYPTV